MATLRRIAGILTIILAILSIIISIILTIRLWQIQDPLEGNLLSVLSLVSETLTTTNDGLNLMQDTLDDASQNISTIQDALLAMAQSFNDTGTTLEDLSKLLDEDIPLTISNTQKSLESAEVTAAVIDDIMTALSKIPLINITYDPEIPLDVTLDEVSTSLDNIPASLILLSKDLTQTQDSLENFAVEIIELINEMDSLDENIRMTHDVIDQYLEQVNRLNSWVITALDTLPGWMVRASLFITFLMIWLLIIQIGLLLQGLSLLGIETS